MILDRADRSTILLGMVNLRSRDSGRRAQVSHCGRDASAPASWQSREPWRTPMNRKRVGIVIFPDVEVLDFCGPYEVFSVTRLDEARRREEPRPFEVLLVAEGADPVVATGGLRVIPDVTIDGCPPLDILVVPGGWGTRTQIKNPRLLAWIAERGKGVETLTSVCTGSMLLGE